MNSNLTSQLLFLLGASSALGAIIGACLARLRAVKQQRQLITNHRQSIKQQASALESATFERDAARRSLDGERRAAAQAMGEAEQSTAQHDALQLHSRLQAQRIATYESERVAADEQHTRLQRDFASYKANNTRELRTHGDSDELPVLNKRVDRHHGKSASSAPHVDADGSVLRATSQRPLISREFEIPPLAESELPDAGDELDLELAMSGDDSPSERG